MSETSEVQNLKEPTVATEPLDAGPPAADAKHVCKDKLAAMKFVCDGCGRVAMEKEHLCKPAPIGK